MTEPKLGHLLENAWSYLSVGGGKNANARVVVLATVDPNGQPEARSVVLRAATRDQSRIEFHADLDSQKVSSLSHNPNAQIHLWHPKDKIQLRLDVAATLRCDDYASLQWQKVPSPSQIAYGKTPPVGARVAGPFEYKNTPSQENFVVVDCKVSKIDYLSLDGPHFRAVFEARDEWKGCWISP